MAFACHKSLSQNQNLPTYMKNKSRAHQVTRSFTHQYSYNTTREWITAKICINRVSFCHFGRVWNFVIAVVSFKVFIAGNFDGKMAANGAFAFAEAHLLLSHWPLLLLFCCSNLKYVNCTSLYLSLFLCLRYLAVKCMAIRFLPLTPSLSLSVFLDLRVSKVL